VLFRSLEGRMNYLDRINRDGTGRGRVIPQAIIDLIGGSPDYEWVTVRIAEDVPGLSSDQLAVNVRDGSMRSLCTIFCTTYWSVDGKYLAISMTPLRTPTLVLPLPAGQVFPPFPADGSAAMPAWAKLPGAQMLTAAEVVPIEGASKYFFTKGDNLRNLFRVPIR